MALIENEIQDLSIPEIEKKKFRINGDNDAILEINPSDVNIIPRLNEGYKKLDSLAKKVTELDLGSGEEETTEEQMENISKQLKEIDKDMREQLDYIFDANVSEVCAKNASMYEPINGKFRWEHIIDAIGTLYGNAFKSEFDAISKRVEKHTSKYTKSRKKKG